MPQSLREVVILFLRSRCLLNLSRHLPVLGQVNLPLTTGANAYPFETLVIDNLTYPVVLGRNFLMHFGSVIDLQDNTLTLTGTNSVLLHSSSPPLPDQQREQEPVTVHALAT